MSSTWSGSAPLPAAASQPWVPGDALRLLALQLVGAFVLLSGWVGVAGSSRLSHQFAWTTLAVLGFLLGAIGTGAWLLTGRRAVGLRLQALLHESEVTNVGYGAGAGTTGDLLLREPSVAAGDRVVVAGARRYHRSGCVLVRGKQLQVLTVLAPDRVPCELCAPDEGRTA